MSRLSVLCGRYKKTIDLGSGVVLELKPPPISALPEFIDLASDSKDGKTEMSKEKMAALTGFIKIVVQKSAPDATPEEVDEVIMSNFQVLSQAVTEMMGDLLGGQKNTVSQPKPQ